MRVFLFVILSFSLLLGDRVFYDFEKINLSLIKSSKSYCINNFKKAAKFCYETKFTYPDANSVANFPFKNSLNKELKNTLNLFKKIDIKAKAKEAAQSDFGSSFFDNEKMLLFSVNKIAYTIKYIDTSYSGGAHGSYFESYKNLDKNGKEIKLTDIINDLEGFKKEALKIYKKQRGLKPDEPLTNDGWFDNKFVLAKEFAVTNEGILFTYNSYEVKPYAAGITTFLVPFNRVKNYINSSLLAPLLKTKKEKNYFFADENKGKIYLKLTLTQTGGNKFKVSAKIFNFAEFAQKCWLSISLPQFFNAKDILHLQKSGFKSVKIYPKGSRIYNIEKQKAIKAKYILVEGGLEDAQVGELSFEVNVKALNSLKIYLRASLKESAQEEPYTLPINYSSEYKSDQQGFSVYSIKIE